MALSYRLYTTKVRTDRKNALHSAGQTRYYLELYPLAAKNKKNRENPLQEVARVDIAVSHDKADCPLLRAAHFTPSPQ